MSKKLLYVGDEQSASAIDNVILQRQIEMKVTGLGKPGTLLDLTDVNNVPDVVLDEQVDYVMYDVRIFQNDYLTIAAELSRIEKANGIPVIIAAYGVSPESRLVTALLTVGFKCIITEAELGSIQRSFTRCLNGYYDANGIEKLKSAEVAISRSAESGKSLAHTVAVTGAMPRIGTTTIALRAVKYLNYNGEKAAYIAYTGSEILEMCCAAYKSVKQLDHGGISYKDTAMYPLEAVNSLKKEGYTYLVYDFGAMNQESFSSSGFLDKEVKIIVGGIKPQEIEYTEAALEKPYYMDAKIVFNFVPERMKEDVLEMMVGRRDKVLFAPELSGWFSHTTDTDEFFKKLIPKESEKKKGLWRLIGGKK